MDVSLVVEKCLRCPDSVPTSIVNLGGRPSVPEFDIDRFGVPEALAASRSFHAGIREGSTAGMGTVGTHSDVEESDASVAVVV
jgi:hypothetical protein